MAKENLQPHIKVRYNVIIICIYISGIILLCQLFNLQIINGKEYRETSNTRLSRETVLKASRGDIYDRTGNIIARTKATYNLELYKSKIETQNLNNAILNIINVLEKNNEGYIDNLPITINPFEYRFSNEEEKSLFFKENKLQNGMTAEEVFYKLKEKYEINIDNIEDVKKIMTIRYEIIKNGYSVTKPIIIAKDISIQSVNEFEERNSSFASIHISTQAVRTYPKGSLASHIIGYIGRIDKKEYTIKKDKGYDLNDYIGKMGVESVFEEYLRGKDGIKQIDMSVDGTTSGEYISKEAIAGSDLVLTIDAKLQDITEKALKANIEKIKSGGFGTPSDAKSGAAVVINVNTGEILSIASYPDYEPELFVKGLSNEKWEEYMGPQALFNRAVQGSYAPGSIFKMVTATAALETGVITKTEKILDKGVYALGNTKKNCWIYTQYHSTHGNINVSEAIKHSCNYYFYEMGNRMGIDNLKKYAEYYGLGKKTGVELIGETSGTLASKEEFAENNRTWYGGNTLDAAIGQGDNSFSPLQMVRYIAMLSNGGKYIRPTIIKTIINSDGTQVSKEEIQKFSDNKTKYKEERIEDITLNPENLKTILEGMKSVTTESGGTAYSVFKNFNIEVGGKTGSTENEGTGYINAWFAGFAPFENPEIAVVVIVENGGHGYYTAEVVRDIIKEYFGINSENINENTISIPFTEFIR